MRDKRDPVLSTLMALERARGGIAVMWVDELDRREWVVGEVDSLVPASAHPVRAQDVESALAEPTRVVLLVPDNEREVVLGLDGSRERLLDRTQPVVLFLMRDGEGQQALAAEAPSLASWVGGRDVDVEDIAEIDPKVEREAFQAEHGCSPEQWLVGWRSGSVLRTNENYGTAFRAMFLQEP